MELRGLRWGAYPKSRFWLYIDAEVMVLVLPSPVLSSGLCFSWLPIYVVIQLPPTRAQFLLLCWCGLSRGFCHSPRRFLLRVSISQSTGILESTYCLISLLELGLPAPQTRVSSRSRICYPSGFEVALGSASPCPCVAL